MDGPLNTCTVVDTDGVITSCNDWAVQLFGHDASEAVGHSVDLIVREHLRKAHWAAFQRAMAAPVVKNLAADLTVLYVDGRVRELAGRLLALSDGVETAI